MKPRRALLHTPDDGHAHADALSELGWILTDPRATTSVDLLIVSPPPQPSGPGPWSAARAMSAAAEAIDVITQSRERLHAAGGLALVAVDDPPGRALTDHPGGGVVSAALAMGVRLLAADWALAGTARCLLVVTAGVHQHRLAPLGHWLTDPQAPALTGQAIDLAALDHATLRMGPALSPNGTE
jgi:hypothetical protein